MPRSLGGLGHPPSRVGGQGLQIAPGPLGIQNTQRQGGLPGTGHAGNGDNLIEGNIHVDIFQVVDPRPAYFYDFGHCRLLLGILVHLLFLHIQPSAVRNTVSIIPVLALSQDHIANLTNRTVAELKLGAGGQQRESTLRQ